MAVIFVAASMVVALLACGSVEPVGAKTSDACSKRAFRLQFWPDGTSGDPRPHVVVYPGARGRTRQQDRIGNADMTNVDAFVCGNHADFAPRVKQMRRKVRTSSAVQLVCRPRRVHAFGVPSSTPGVSSQSFGQVQVRGADRRILYAIFNPATHMSQDGRPLLQYDSRVCVGRRIRCTNVSPPCRLSGGGVSTRGSEAL